MSFERSNFFSLHPDTVDAARSWLMPFLTEFARETCLVSPEDVIRQAKDCDCKLWSYYDGEKFRGVVATRLHKNTVGLVCSMWVCVGVDATDLMEGVHAEIEDWAQGVGCYALEIVGRPGWEKMLKGYRRTAVVLEKRLTEAH